MQLEKLCAYVACTLISFSVSFSTKSTDKKVSSIPKHNGTTFQGNFANLTFFENGNFFEFTCESVFPVQVVLDDGKKACLDSSQDRISYRKRHSKLTCREMKTSHFEDKKQVAKRHTNGTESLEVTCLPKCGLLKISCKERALLHYSSTTLTLSHGGSVYVTVKKNEGRSQRSPIGNMGIIYVLPIASFSLVAGQVCLIIIVYYYGHRGAVTFGDETLQQIPN